MRSILGSVCLAASSAALAALSAPALAAPDSGQWCPGQPWHLVWGVNWDAEHCHGVAKPNDVNTDLHGGATFDPNPPSDYPPGQYPPNYNWGEHYPYNTSPYGDSRKWGQHN